MLKAQFSLRIVPVKREKILRIVVELKKGKKNENEKKRNAAICLDNFREFTRYVARRHYKCIASFDLDV